VAPKFLVIQTAFPGDVILATALVEKLRQFYPESRIHFLLRRGNESILAQHPYLKKVWVWDKGSNKARNLLRLARQIRKKGFTHVINAHRFASSGLLTALSGAKHRIGFAKNPLAFRYTQKLPHTISPPEAQQGVHEVERNQSLIASLTDPIPAWPRLYPSATDYEAVKPLQGQSYVCIAPASVWPTKQFPAQRWASLAQKLSAEHHIHILGGPSDALLSADIVAKAGLTAESNLCGRLSFLQSAALMEGAVMNYTNDSAPLHMATAMRAPLTAVFCSTVPQFGFGPLDENGRVVEHPGPLYCRPCGLHGRKACPEGHFRCALDIREDDLLWWKQP
jgi:heptosyltransferase-2